MATASTNCRTRVRTGCLFYLVSCCLIAGNLVMLAPTRWTVAHLKPDIMHPVQPVLQHDRSDPATLVFQDGLGLAGTVWASFPIGVIDERLQWRRIEHLAEISRFAVWVEQVKEPQYVLGAWEVDQPQQLLGIWEGRETWRPIDGLPIRFVFPNALDLPPGKYEVTVYHCADPPWGWGGCDSLSAAPPSDDREPNRLVLPGQFLLLHNIYTLSITVDRPE